MARGPRESETRWKATRRPGSRVWTLDRREPTNTSWDPPPEATNPSPFSLAEPADLAGDELVVDQYQIHRWDPDTPIEETMETLHDVVRAGEVRYLGASSMWAWQLARAQHVAAVNGWTPSVSMQNHDNLL